jgi:hypothetical protein
MVTGGNFYSGTVVEKRRGLGPHHLEECRVGPAMT